MTTKYIRSEGCESLQVDTDCMVLNLDQYTVTQLNAIGADCWNRLTEPMSIEELAAQLRAEYGTEVPSIEEDVCAFVEELSRYGLIQAMEDNGAA